MAVEKRSHQRRKFVNMLHIFTEERSAQKFFEALMLKIFAEQNISQNIAKERFRVYGYSGKEDLKKSLQTTVPTISKQPEAKILITIDQDGEDCRSLKNDLENIIKNKCHCPHKIRIICRELESWFLGDLEAIARSYPRFKADQYRNKSDFKNIDASKQKPSVALLKIIPDFKGLERLSKVAVAEKISQNLDLQNNTSTSFNATIGAIKQLIN